MDTWAWLALANRRDANHEFAKACYAKLTISGYKLITSDYVLDELITALFKNVAFNTALRFIESLLAAINSNRVLLELVTENRFRVAWSLRKKYKDKPDISFTDLTSMVTMQDLTIYKVFTGDAHFEEVNLGFELLRKWPAAAR
ncbi:type II toxin-antitoxin system VapC family toxin [Vibrio sp.]|uniref:type II toxin-antitoxin system VapC family toxin n=1 Tax=Vibrio sp. TaxID=678 RepID=UPI003D1352EE